jgi:hypothetical protein
MVRPPKKQECRLSEITEDTAMVDRALSDFAEAVAGHNRDMQWSLSSEIMSRSVKPIFSRLYEGKLSTEQALAVAMDFVQTRVRNNVDTCQGLFQTLDARLEATLHGVSLPAQTALSELFLGLNEEFNWCTEPHLMADDLRPTFQRVERGNLVPEQAVMIFVDATKIRTETMLSCISTLLVQVAEQFRAVLIQQQANEKAVNGNGQDQS